MFTSLQSIPILRVSDDSHLQTEIRRRLSNQGFNKVLTASNGMSALRVFSHHLPKIVIIDPPLVDYDPIDVIVTMAHLQQSTKSVLLLHPHQVLPLAAYQEAMTASLSRDFPPEEWWELLARMMNGGATFEPHGTTTAQLDRETVASNGLLNSAPHGSPSPDALSHAQNRDNGSTLRFGSLVIALAHHHVSVQGRPVHLTPQEYALLLCLARNSDRVVTIDELLSDAWGYDVGNGTPAQVRLYIARLRKKLGEDSDGPSCIVTERGVGYRLVGAGAPPQATPATKEFGKVPVAEDTHRQDRAVPTKTLTITQSDKVVMAWQEQTAAQSLAHFHSELAPARAPLHKPLMQTWSSETLLPKMGLALATTYVLSFLVRFI